VVISKVTHFLRNCHRGGLRVENLHLNNRFLLSFLLLSGFQLYGDLAIENETKIYLLTYSQQVLHNIPILNHFEEINVIAY